MMIGSMIPFKKYQKKTLKNSRTKNKFLVTFYCAKLIILCKRKQTINKESKKQSKQKERNLT